MEAGALRAPAALNRISVTVPLLRLRSDEQLVALFRAGSDAAFSVIHDRYRQRLFAYSRQMLGGSRQDAEDALQDVFMRAYSSLRSNNRPLSLRAWLYRVAHNRCIDQLRKPVPPAVDLFDSSRKPLLDPMDEVERREDLRRLVADVRRLPDQQRSALLMREMDGMSYAELGDALGISLQAVKSLLVRARIGLVEAVEARDTACSEIRVALADSFDRGVRASGLARRHMRDCAGCVEYRGALRGVRQGLSVLAPGGAGPFAAVLKLVGIGGAGSAGAASAGGGAAAGGGALAVAGTGTAAKVAAVFCCAALTAGGAAEVRDQVAGKPAPPPASSKPTGARAPQGPAVIGPRSPTSAALAAGSGALPATRGNVEEKSADGGAGRTVGRHIRAVPAEGGATAPMSDPAAGTPIEDDLATGGSSAPHEETGFGYGADGLDPRPHTSVGTTAPDAKTAPTAEPQDDDGIAQPGPAYPDAAPSAGAAESAASPVAPG